MEQHEKETGILDKKAQRGKSARTNGDRLQMKFASKCTVSEIADEIGFEMYRH